ncbi:MAG: OmpA family protein, partial [Bacteroidales bacterium]|nr:OmpA family protein [Bacteroidales bacterium]
MINVSFIQFLKLLAAIFISLILVSKLPAQELSTKSGKAIKLFDEGRKNFNLGYYDLAEKALKKALEADDKFLEAHMLLADVYKSTKDSGKALEIYNSVIRIDDQKYPEVYFFSGLLHFNSLEYSLAIERLVKYLSFNNQPPERVGDANFYKDCAVFAIQAVENPVNFIPVNIGKEVNTPNDEYINALRADGLTLYFTGRQCQQNGSSGGDDFYFSTRTSDNLNWGNVKKLGAPINTSGDEGALTISPDGRYLLFAGCQWEDGFGSCDIYASKLSLSRPGKPSNLGSVINTHTWESQPSLSSDGRTLYFASSRSSGKGKSDIWKSYLQDSGIWSKPENLGERINTSGSEMAPFIHPDGQTLYFSSDRHIGMGGIDLFVSRLDSLGNWAEAKNLGYPLNTSGDEINIIVDAAGNKGFISSNQLGGFGGYDIFEFELYDEIKPIASTFMKGVVRDALTKNPVEAYFSLINLKSKKEVVRSFSDEKTGEFLVCIPTNCEYALNVSKQYYLFYSENISLTGLKTDMDPYLININLNPLLAGETMVLRNIFFDVGDFSLKDESLVELDKLLEFLGGNSKISIEIQGHTDNIGTELFNQELSENRAMAVYNYLVNSGIDRSRLQYKGFGYSKPLFENTT